MKIKALSLWQPWASLVAWGEKKFETRSWSTGYRGLLAIHATKRPVDVNDLRNEHMLIAFKRNTTPVRHLPLGAVLCVVRLVDVVTTEDALGLALGLTEGPGSSLKEFNFGNYSPGRFAWRLEMVHCFADPIPATGRQGLWEWDCPIAIT